MHASLFLRSFAWGFVLVVGAVISVSGTGVPRLERDAAVHVANRLTFGATPATVERLQANGLDAWLEAQLHPERMADPRLEARLAALTTLTLTPRALAEINLRAQERRRASQAAMQAPGAGEVAVGGAEPGMERPAAPRISVHSGR